MAEHRHLATCHPYFIDVSCDTIHRVQSPTLSRRANCLLTRANASIQFPKNLPEGTTIRGMTRERKPIVPQPGIDIIEFDVPLRDGANTTLRTYRQAASANRRLPALVYMHGGGFVTGSLETDDAPCRAIAEALDLVVVNVEYRLAPEYQFPVGFEDCFDVVRWVGFNFAFSPHDTRHVLQFMIELSTDAGINTRSLLPRDKRGSAPTSPRASSSAAPPRAPTSPRASRTWRCKKP